MKTWVTKNGYSVFQLLSGRSNVFLVSNDDKNIIIDTSPERNWKKLNKAIKSLNLQKIDYLILTHTHYDHAGNTLRLKKYYNTSVIVHKSEITYLTTGKNISISGTNKLTSLLIKSIYKMTSKFFKYEPGEYNYLVDSTYNLKEIGFNGYIMCTPGHTRGSISVIIDDEIAVVGDCMFGIFKNSLLPPFVDNTDQLMDSWDKLLDTKCNLFLPSHGKEKTRAQLKADYDKKKNKYALCCA